MNKSIMGHTSRSARIRPRHEPAPVPGIKISSRETPWAARLRDLPFKRLTRLMAETLRTPDNITASQRVGIARRAKPQPVSPLQHGNLTSFRSGRTE